MKKHLLLLSVILITVSGLFAQEKAEVSVKITKNGKTVKDTTYSFNSIEEADQAMKMMELSRDDHMYLFKSGDENIHFFSEDMDSICHEDHMHWYTSSINEEGDSVKIVKVNSKGKGHSSSHVYVTGAGSEEVYCLNTKEGKTKIIVSGEEGDEDVKVISKKIMLISGDEGEWTVKEGDDGEIIMISEDGKVKKIKNTGEKGKLESDGTWHIKKEGDNSEEIIIIKKKKGSSEDEVEVEVTVEEKTKKKNK